MEPDYSTSNEYFWSAHADISCPLASISEENVPPAIIIDKNEGSQQSVIDDSSSEYKTAMGTLKESRSTKEEPKVLLSEAASTRLHLLRNKLRERTLLVYHEIARITDDEALMDYSSSIDEDDVLKNYHITSSPPTTTHPSIQKESSHCKTDDSSNSDDEFLVISTFSGNEDEYYSAEKQRSLYLKLSGSFRLSWTTIVTMVFIYNFISIPLRISFPVRMRADGVGIVICAA
ncbi:hypothetical protein ACOME3_001806 [Neoechinorhynchus agilis]